MLRQAYIELSKRLHPDRSAHKSDAEQERDNTRYQTVTEAYNTLSRPIDRRDYDNKLFHSQSGMQPHSHPCLPPSPQIILYPLSHLSAPSAPRFLQG